MYEKPGYYRLQATGYRLQATGYCSLLIRVLKIRMNFWTTGLVQWSTISDNQNHQTSRSLLVDGLVHPYTMKLFSTFWQLPVNILATFCSQDCLKWDKLTIHITKCCISGKGKDDNFVQITNLHFLIINFKIYVFLGKTVQCNAVQCVLQYTRSKTLLLGTSLHKPYCSEVHLLNQHSLHIWPAVYWVFLVCI